MAQQCRYSGLSARGVGKKAFGTSGIYILRTDPTSLNLQAPERPDSFSVAGSTYRFKTNRFEISTSIGVRSATKVCSQILEIRHNDTPLRRYHDSTLYKMKNDLARTRGYANY